MSDIVKRFYSPLEKLGFKKHNHTQEEIEYLNSFEMVDQMSKYVDESDFNINRISIKFHISRGISIFLFVLATLSFSFFWIVPTTLFLLSVVLYVISNHLDTALFVWKVQKGLCYCTRKELVGIKRDEQVTAMFR